MTLAAAFRRGACPGLSAPMPTGDGLLARLMPVGTITLDAMTGLAAAAARHGNGIVEITSRGSLQVRGLRPDSAPAFADAVAELGIAAQEGVPVVTDPVAGLDPDELIDAGALAAALRAALAHGALAVSPKVSIAVDGGGALHLDALAADIRLRAIASPQGPRLHVALGGDAQSARPLGTITCNEAIDSVMRLMRVIAARGPQARGRDLDACRSHLDDIAKTEPEAPRPRGPADPICLRGLRDGTVAVGMGFAFGHTDAVALTSLAHAAQDAGAHGMRAAPGRALVIIGVAAEHVAALIDAARSLGLIVAPDDPRRRVVACAGAPVCASAEIAARTLAPQVAASAAARLAPGEVIHISGCAKGCAYRGTAALAAIGRAGACDLVVDGTPAGSIAAAALPQRLATLAAARRASHG